MSEIKLELLRRLRAVSTTPDARYGICTQVRTVLKHLPIGDAVRLGLYDELIELFKQWPGYSGNSDYPVPADWGNAELAYTGFRDRNNLWGRHPYGDRRRELLAFCISTLEQELYGGLLARDRLFLHFKEQGCTTTQANAAVKYTTPGAFMHFVASGELRLDTAFAWGDTPEGFLHWSNITYG